MARGKSTQLQVMADCLRQAGLDVLETREPGGTPIAEAMRGLLLESWDEEFDPLSQMMLVFAARRQHVETVIKPALAAGRTVLCDRFTDSTVAYQHGGYGADRGTVDALADMAHGSIHPDFTLYLDVTPSVSFERLHVRGKELDRMEQENMEFFHRVRNAYLDIANGDPDRVFVVDATQDLDQVTAAVETVTTDFIRRAQEQSAEAECSP